MGVFNFCSCSCCSRRTPRVRCVFANATFTGGRATARSHENRSRGVVLSCRVRWHMRGGMRVPYHARAPQQREQRSRFGHWPCDQCGQGGLVFLALAGPAVRRLGYSARSWPAGRRLTGPVAEWQRPPMWICVGPRDPATKPSRGCIRVVELSAIPKLPT